MTDEALLEVAGLETSFFSQGKGLPILDGISFSIKKGQTLGMVGESGCGKSVCALSILNLIPQPPAKVKAKSLMFAGKSLLGMDEAGWQSLRGRRLSMIFQEPMSSLNPVLSIGFQIAEVFQLHQGLCAKEARARSIELLEAVKIPAAAARVDEYPHQMSGGMRQRVMIAMALACKPDLLVADEPTTALDVTIQAQILSLLNDLQTEMGMAVLLITHDLAVVSETCEQVVVMYAGQIVEQAAVADLFREPLHPYTRGLLASRPHFGKRVERLAAIEGAVARPGSWLSGCRFRDRCPEAQDICAQQVPVLEGDTHRVACHFSPR